MKQILIDTDILSYFFRGNKKIEQQFENNLQKYNFINISIITYYEILNGLIYNDAKNQINIFNAFCEQNIILPLTIPSVKLSANIFSELKQSGQIISHTDVLIAGIAISNNLKLITNNIEHFSRIPNLYFENWNV